MNQSFFKIINKVEVNNSGIFNSFKKKRNCEKRIINNYFQFKSKVYAFDLS